MWNVEIQGINIWTMKVQSSGGQKVKYRIKIRTIEVLDSGIWKVENRL
jgi:hypothetical protein